MSTSFLSLPPEIRNRIYGLCTPIDAFVEEYKGLLLVSRQVCDEYESETLALMRQLLTSIQHQWPHSEALRISNPKEFKDVDRITVQLPLSLYFPSEETPWSHTDSYNKTSLESSLVALYTLHLTKLTFSFYDDSTSITWRPHSIPGGLLEDIISPLLSPMNFMMRRNGRSKNRLERVQLAPDVKVRIRKLVYDWSASKAGPAMDILTRTELDLENKSFFLSESNEIGHPRGLVHNWGQGADLIWLDLMPEREKR